MELKKNKGVALIAVIVMIVLLSSIIIAVVLTATISIRRANFYNNKLIAYELAERGIQEIFYRLNYSGYEEIGGISAPTYRSNLGNGWQTFNSLNQSPISIPQWYRMLISSFQPTDFTIYATTISYPELWKDASCRIYFVDVNSSTQQETDLDLIISEGIYKGRYSKISFLLRGTGEVKEEGGFFYYGDYQNKNPNRTLGSCGIAEAFNKHVIYANSVSISGAVNKGNITTLSQKPNSLPSDVTWTETNVILPEIKFNVPILPLRPSTFTENYDSYGNFNGNPALPPGVTFNLLSRTYTFQSPYNQSGPVKIEGANAILSNNPRINNYFYLTQSIIPPLPAGNLTIDGNIIFTDDACLEVENPGTITINSGSTINGNLMVKGINLNISNNITINGSLIAEVSDLTISGSNIVINGSLVVKSGNLSIANNITINSTTSTKQAGIIVYNGNLTISSPINITIGNNQISSILVYSDQSNPRTLNINASPVFNFPTSTNQLAIIGYNTQESININISGNIPRGVFCRGNNNNGNITLNSGSITGLLIANGNLSLTSGTITYDPNPFKNNSEVYKGFVGGRRKYLPVIGSWRIEW